mmetsp:Transcript_132842/g.314851  ORF Transcript_132842/g.314851 Transcript_132842/m.314851 type:complete len:270 (+) Transcript_132842:252-1061(+)
MAGSAVAASSLSFRSPRGERTKPWEGSETWRWKGSGKSFVSGWRGPPEPVPRGDRITPGPGSCSGRGDGALLLTRSGRGQAGAGAVRENTFSLSSSTFSLGTSGGLRQLPGICIWVSGSFSSGCALANLATATKAARASCTRISILATLRGVGATPSWRRCTARSRTSCCARRFSCSSCEKTSDAKTSSSCTSSSSFKPVSTAAVDSLRTFWIASLILLCISLMRRTSTTLAEAESMSLLKAALQKACILGSCVLSASSVTRQASSITS